MRSLIIKLPDWRVSLARDLACPKLQRREVRKAINFMLAPHVCEIQIDGLSSKPPLKRVCQILGNLKTIYITLAPLWTRQGWENFSSPLSASIFNALCNALSFRGNYGILLTLFFLSSSRSGYSKHLFKTLTASLLYSKMSKRQS